MRYRIGEYCIDAELFEVRRGAALIDCQAQVFNLILFLIQQRERVLTPDEILRAVWGDTRVDRASLSTAMKAARRVLGDTGRAQHVIATVWKRGYRFVADVEELARGDEPPAAVARGDAVATRDTPLARPAAGERRRLTALVCDLVDALALPEEDSAEDAHATVRGYRAQVAEVIAACGGSLAQSLGDELLAYFGYPEAHEDDPVRAVHAALRILAARPDLSTRIGIDSGEVAIAPADPAYPLQEPLVFGRALNRAHRIQERAEPGTVLVSAATFELLHGAFESESLGSRTLPGGRPLVLHRVLGAKREPHRLDRIQSGLWSPLIGRSDELRRLRQAWSLAMRGQGRAIWIAGEAGVGKSRLLRELRARIESDEMRSLALQSSPLHVSSPFHALSEALRAMFPAETDLRDDALAKLGLDGARDAELLRSFLEPCAQPAAAAPEDLHERTLRLLIRVVLGVARSQPLLLGVEDLHWSDPSTLEFLSRMVDQVPGARILLVLTARTHFVCPWLHRAHVQRVEVVPLDRDQTQDLARRVGGEGLPAELVQAIALRSDGLPLFIEELTRSALLESSTPERIPSTLQDALTARLDHVPGARSVAQVASVIGRRFAYVLLRALCDADEAQLAPALEQLQAADLLHQEGILPDATFVFRHALLRDAAYHSLLRPERERLHRLAAHALARECAAGTGASEVIAYHFEEAGEIASAIEHYREASLSATRRQASREALTHLERATALLERLPPGQDRRSRELGLLLAQTTPVGMVRGYESQETEQVLRRAHELACELGDEGARFHALRSMVACYSGRGDLTTSIGCARQLLSIGELNGERERRLVAHLALAIPLLWRADWSQSLQHSAQTLALCADEPRLELAHRYGWDQEVVARLYSAYALWALGKSESALRMNQQAIELARKLEHPPSTAQALAFTAGTHLLRREVGDARRCADEAIRVASQHGLRGPLALAHSVRVWTVAEERLPQGDFAEARPGFGLSRSPTATGSAGRPLIFGALAETYLAAGQPGPALECVEHCLELLPREHGYFFDAELHRLHGECLLARGAPAAVVLERFEQALDLARKQQALALELRAAMSLCRMDPAQHGAGLRSVVGRFSEGFDVGDLRSARELLRDRLGIGVD